MKLWNNINMNTQTKLSTMIQMIILRSSVAINAFV